MSARDSRGTLTREPTDRLGSGRTLGTAVALFAAAAATVLGIGSGVPVPTALAAVAGLLVGASVSLLESRSLARRTAGSCGLAGGGALAVVAVLVGGPLAVAALFASGATALALLPTGGATPVVRRTAQDLSVGAVLTALAVTVAVSDGTATALALLSGIIGLSTTSAATGFTSAILLAAAALLLVATAGTLLEEAAATELPAPTIESVAERLSGLPTWALLVPLFFVAVLRFEGTARTFTSALEALGPVGAGLEFALTSGVVHVPLAVVAVIAAFTYVAVASKPLATTWLGSYPLRTLSLASGGVLVALLAVAVSTTTTIVSPAASVWSVVALFVTGLVVVYASTSDVLPSWVARWLSSRRLLGLGAGSLLVLTVLGSTIGLEPLLVFGGVAGALLIWDVGENALSMRTQLGEDVDTRQAELVHATASTAVGVAGVAVAGVAMYGVGTVTPPASRWHAVAPLALALVAVVAFAFTAVNRERSLSSIDAHSVYERVRRPPGHPFSSVVALAMVLSIGLLAAGYHDLGRLLLIVPIFALPLLFVLILAGYASSEAPPLEKRL